MDDEKTTEQAAELLHATRQHEYDERLVRDMAHEMDPDAWLPEHLPDADKLTAFAMLQWAGRRFTAIEHARAALPWVKRQTLAAYQEGYAAADAIEGAL